MFAMLKLPGENLVISVAELSDVHLLLPQIVVNLTRYFFKVFKLRVWLCKTHSHIKLVSHLKYLAIMFELWK